MMRQLSVSLLVILSAIAAKADEGTLSTDQPKGTTAQEIIQKFTAKEKQFKEARKRCTYRQVVKIEAFDGDKSQGDNDCEQFSHVVKKFCAARRMESIRLRLAAIANYG